MYTTLAYDVIMHCWLMTHASVHLLCVLLAATALYHARHCRYSADTLRGSDAALGRAIARCKQLEAALEARDSGVERTLKQMRAEVRECKGLALLTVDIAYCHVALSLLPLNV
jgi:hypothetical protein